MDAVKYLKTLRRLCESKERCPGCVLYNKEDSCCIADIGESAEDTVQIVEQWGKDHTVKTRKSEFLKLFPNAEMVSIERTFCIAHFDPTKKCKKTNPSDEQCIACRYRFWNEEVTDND